MEDSFKFIRMSQYINNRYINTSDEYKLKMLSLLIIKKTRK